MMITSEVVQGYCLAVRSALTDGRPPLMPLVAASKRLTQIQESLERLEQRGCQSHLSN